MRSQRNGCHILLSCAIVQRIRSCDVIYELLKHLIQFMGSSEAAAAPLVATTPDPQIVVASSEYHMISISYYYHFYTPPPTTAYNTFRFASHSLFIRRLDPMHLHTCMLWYGEQSIAHSIRHKPLHGTRVLHGPRSTHAEIGEAIIRSGAIRAEFVVLELMNLRLV